jgi:hypothetical protein
MPDVKFGPSQINNPTPKAWSRVSTSIRYFLVSMTGLVAATDLIPAKTAKILTLTISGVILLLKAIDMGLGVQSEGEQPKAGQ